MGYRGEPSRRTERGDEHEEDLSASRRATARSSDVEREIENHIELRAREFEAQGMSRDEARQAAIEAFGDREAIEDEVVDIRRVHRVATRQRRDWLDELRQDVKVGVRVLRRAPSFAHRRDPHACDRHRREHGDLRRVALRCFCDRCRIRSRNSSSRSGPITGRSDAREPEWLTPPDFVDFRDGNSTFSAMAAYQGWGPDLTGTGDPQTRRPAHWSRETSSTCSATRPLGRLLSIAPTTMRARRASWC